MAWGNRQKTGWAGCNTNYVGRTPAAWSIAHYQKWHAHGTYALCLANILTCKVCLVAWTHFSSLDGECYSKGLGTWTWTLSVSCLEIIVADIFLFVYLFKTENYQVLGSLDQWVTS